MVGKTAKILSAIMLIAFVIVGCGKKYPVLTEDPGKNYAPAAIHATPDTQAVKLTWDQNSEAESQGGFGGYYVYCTSRDSGLTKVPPESLSYYEVTGSPFDKGEYTTTVTIDPTLFKAGASEQVSRLRPGIRYYFYVRAMVDGQLSPASQWAWSSPRPEIENSLYTFAESKDTLNRKCAMGLYRTKGLYFGYDMYTASRTLVRIPYVAWSDTVVDSTVSPAVRTITPMQFIGIALSDTLRRTYYKFWVGNGIDSSITRKKSINDTMKNYPGKLDTIALIAERVPNTSDQVRLVSPRGTMLPDSSWLTKGRDTRIKALSSWSATEPGSFLPTDLSVTFNIAQTGQAYAIKYPGPGGTYYLKLRVDSCTVISPNPDTTKLAPVKIYFRYAFQLAPDVKSF